ncbi:MAG: bifunctional UDP-N-acetylmuramoyl-tripeptide:D-alanyl-D-alanine ligase/alanine racemase [Bacteroidales bacterium]|nr:bifunctional UDP-N-acetylmuramoyl-tripeptide:D-alanyl-D-alanine ligase/alanine racemase [Bacteroidales bacterium]MDE7072085.1 bifunctional UDP-N-acetylmuramoyl-tripeptide:D-alanyl-D-alanine ligase/alanine racemase [Bacteroidales bacterium]
MKIARLSFGAIVRATNGRCIDDSAPKEKKEYIDRIITDSRSAETRHDSLFVALVTRKGDGHRYLQEMYDSGVRHFMVDPLNPVMSKLNKEAMKGARFIDVQDTLSALQRLACYRRSLFNLPVVGITGSNGKTVVKEWISYLLGFDRNVVRSPQSYNSQLGVALSVLQLRKEYGVGVFEAGISQEGEMEQLAAMIKPTVGILTNIGPAHDAGFSGRAAKIAEKLRLFEYADQLIYCADYKEITEAIPKNREWDSVRIFTWSFSPETKADLQLKEVSDTLTGTLLKARYKDEEISVEIPFSDKASVENAMHCWLYMLISGYENAEIARRIKHLPAVEMRMEMKEGVGESSVINDVYNSDYNSFCMAVDFLHRHHHNRPRCVIMSDILESGRQEKELYRDVADILRGRQVEETVCIGAAVGRQKDSFKGLNARFYPDTDAFLASFEERHYYGKSVLLKGARLFRFERIGNLLQRKVHETVLEVNLTALVHNLNYFRSLIEPSTKLMVMGKAFSYGSGSHEIADTLEYNHVDYVAVAYPDEAVALRNNGIRLPVMCMNPEEEGMETVLRYGVEPVIYNMRVFKTMQRYMDRLSIDGKEPVGIHLALDTGMHRMGLEEKDLDEFLPLIQKERRCVLKSVFTHLATADMPGMDGYTLAQLDKFKCWSERIQAAFPYKVMRHCLNTAGIFRFPRYQFDMVRLGIGLYGVGTDEEMQANLETVSTLKTVISQVRTIAPGEAVSYGRRFVAERETKVGVIGIGYADGLNRHLGNGRGKVWVKGKRVPIIGSICMDMCMIDLTDTDAVEKDEVIVFGPQNPISNLAETLETIPYEILTGISQRVKRIYYQE